MIELIKQGILLKDGKLSTEVGNINKAEAKNGTIAYQILNSHNKSNEKGKLRIKFDALMSHDITYVGIIQIGRASCRERV